MEKIVQSFFVVLHRLFCSPEDFMQYKLYVQRAVPVEVWLKGTNKINLDVNTEIVRHFVPQPVTEHHFADGYLDCTADSTTGSYLVL